MRAVLRPSLRQTLKFSICRGSSGQTKALPRHSDFGVAIVRLNGVHLIEIEGEQPCLTNLLQLLVAHLKVDESRLSEDSGGSVGKSQRRPTSGGAIICSRNSAALNHWIVNHSGKFGGIGAFWKAPEHIGPACCNLGLTCQSRV